MKNHVLFIAAAALLPTIGLAADVSGCSNFSLPNFLGLGKCLKTSGDLCTTNSEGVTPFVGNLVQCSLKGIATLNPGSQIYLITELLKYLLERNDFGVLLPLLTSVCKGINDVIRTASGGLLTIDCTALSFNRKAVCGAPIFISVQLTTPFAMCLNETGLTCAANRPVDEPAAIGFVRILACLLSYALTTAPSEVATQLGCDLIASLSTLLGRAGTTTLKPFTCALQEALDLSCPAVSC